LRDKGLRQEGEPTLPAKTRDGSREKWSGQVIGADRCRARAEQTEEVWVTDLLRSKAGQTLKAGLSPRLVLSADGRFTATDLPGAFHGTVGVVDRNSGSGRWKFITKDGRQQIQVSFDGDYGTQFEIAKDGGV
jgi:hypothetical protein